MSFRVCGLFRGKGHTDSIELDYGLTDLDEEAKNCTSNKTVTVNPIY